MRAAEQKLSGCYWGGCTPNAIIKRRKLTTTSRFKSKLFTVACPVAVMPMIRRKSSLHRKWSLHISRRGWNSGTRFLLSGSIAVVFVYFLPLQPRQASARLSGSSVPPKALGTICSIDEGSWLRSRRLRQYSQYPPARTVILCFSSAERRGLGILRTDFHFLHE